METQEKIFDDNLTTLNFEIAGFEILREIGRGASSIIFEAMQNSLHRHVAIKVLRADIFDSVAARRFQKESNLLSSLNHPNIVTVYASGVTAGNRPYIILELIDGENLASLLQNGPLETADTLQIFSQVLQGLQFAHDKQIVHRDIKPGNIMLSRSGSGWIAKLVDFGIARTIRESGQVVQNLTHTGNATGTALYMSPEQCSGTPPSTFSDLYSVGCVLYEAITGEPPFHGETSYEVMYKQVHEEPRTLSQQQIPVSTALMKLVLRAMNKNPQQRFPDAGAMLAAMADVEPGEHAPQRKVPYPFLATASILLAVLSLTTFLVVSRKSSCTEPYLPDKKSQQHLVPSVTEAVRQALNLFSDRQVHEAEQVLRTSLNKCEIRATVEAREEGHLTLGKAYVFQHRWSEAFAEFKQCEKLILEVPGNKAFKYAELHSWMSSAYMETGDTNTSERILQNAISSFSNEQAIFAYDLVSGMYTKLGTVYREKGAPAKALQCNLKGLKTRLTVDKENTAGCIDALAYIAIDQYILGNHQEARENVTKAIDIIKAGDVDDRPYAFSIVRDALTSGEQYQPAKELSEQLLLCLQRMNADAEFFMDAHANLAFINMKLGKLPAAEQHITKALRIAERCSDPMIWFTYMVAGELSLRAGDQEQATIYLRRAEDTPREKLFWQYEHRLHWLLSRIHGKVKSDTNDTNLKHLQIAYQQWRNFSPQNEDYAQMLRDYLAVLHDSRDSATAKKVETELKQYEKINPTTKS